MGRVEDALAATPREQFLPEDVRADAAWDVPLPIGYGQTNSQPTTVRMMLDWLDPQPGDKVLDVGSGSGWTTALLAHLVGPDGYVHAVEKVPELVQFGKENCKRLGLTNVSFHHAGRTFGLSAEAPYERILVSASAAELPPDFIKQIKPKGRLVIPVQSDVLVVDKTSRSSYDVIAHPGFVFVPLILR